jgi:glucose-1-phosphate thymidylyltransferase
MTSLNPCTKGIILAGGSGTRLYPLTKVVNKHLLPIGGKPMVYYPLTTLMLAGIRDVLLISSPREIGQFQSLLEDGSQWGIRVQYAVQARPAGLAEAFLIGEDFIAGNSVALTLGDNLFHGQGFSTLVRDAAQSVVDATVFACAVRNPQQYGVVLFDATGKAVAIEEKPAKPRSNYAVPGLYFYGPDVVARARAVRPSPRGELEITDLNQMYLEDDKLRVQVLGRGIAWFDAGTPEALHATSAYVETIESRQGVGVACPEEVAYRMGFIDAAQLGRLIEAMGNAPYGALLRRIVE